MGGALADVIWPVALVLVLALLAVAVLAFRRYLLERGGGTVECGLRRPGGPWRLGLASYHRDELYWYRALGVLPRVAASLPRRSLEVVSRREPEPDEARVLGSSRVIIELGADPSSHVELAMSDQALTGFLAWLEASPPGSHLQDITLAPPPSLPLGPPRSAVAARAPQHVAVISVGEPGEDE